MTSRGLRHFSALAAAVVSVALGVAHCGPRVVDAVDLGNAGDGSPVFTWPNASSSANSDAWLAAHHDELVGMRPNVMLLDFYNPWAVDQARALALDRIATIAVASRYHGYSDPNAAAFLNYQLAPVIDLTDHPPPAPATRQFDASTNYPVDATGAFDMSALFGSSFAAYFGVPDPTNPSRDLTLCELFEQGIVNELWILAGDERNTVRKPPLMVESKQVYDAQNHAVPGVFDPNTGYQPFIAPACKVTVRIAALSPTSGVDCDLVPAVGGHREHARRHPLPRRKRGRLLQRQLRGPRRCPLQQLGGARQHGPRRVLAHRGLAVPDGDERLRRLRQWHRVDDRPLPAGLRDRALPSERDQGMGLRKREEVQSRCEHYGMHDGLGAGDVTNAYSDAVVSAYSQLYGNDQCGGGWQIYLPQSMPGLDNHAVAADGSPMKNWWPFLFY